MTHRVLLVEDDEEIREVFRLGLEYEGFQVIEAADGLEMISILQLGGVSAIVADIMMPRIDGISAIGTVKTLSHLQNTPIIIVTGGADPDVQARAYEAGAVEILVKPVSAVDIARAVRKYLPAPPCSEM